MVSLKMILPEDQIGHSLNEDLLREAEEIKTERKLLKARMDKLEQSKATASESVYQRVRADYLTKLNKTTERLTALKRDLEEEERKLVEKKTLVEANISFHKETIEESQLRFALGEYTQEQHQSVTTKEKEEVERLKSALTKLGEGLERHKHIFEGEDLPAARPSTLEKKRPAFVTSPGIPLEKPVEKAPREEPAPHEHTAKIQVPPSSVERITPNPIASVAKKVAELVLLEKDKVIQTVPIDKTIAIGRSPSVDIVLNEPKVSRRHAEIQRVGEKYVIIDLESSNGTFVGGKKITEHTLQPNDEISIGNSKLVFKI